MTKYMWEIHKLHHYHAWVPAGFFPGGANPEVSEGLKGLSV